MKKSTYLIVAMFVSLVSFGQNNIVNLNGTATTSLVDNVTANNSNSPHRITLSDNEPPLWTTNNGIQLESELASMEIAFPYQFSEKSTFTRIIQNSQTFYSVDPKLLNITVFLDGAYNGSSGLMNSTLSPLIPLSQPYNVAPWNYAGTESVPSIYAGVVDWVLVELRDAATPEGAVPMTKLSGWPRAFLLKIDGSIVDLDGTSLPNIGTPTINNNLYVLISHRNHLTIMSAYGAGLSGRVYSYDFTTGLAQAYGGANGCKLVGSKAVMVSGDIDKDGRVFVSDYNSWAAEFGKTDEYINSDLDMDNNVYVSDYNKWAANFGSTAGDGAFSDSRDGHVYRTVKIGTQTWMAENLAFLPAVSPHSVGSLSSYYYYVYDYEGTNVSSAKATVNYSTYGVLYNWPAALTACPDGWHLPSDAEWTILSTYLGGEAEAGGKMKEAGTAHWLSPNTGADNSSGFKGLPAGDINYTPDWHDFYYLHETTFFWSSTEYDATLARNRSLGYARKTLNNVLWGKFYGFSIRCVMNF